MIHYLFVEPTENNSNVRMFRLLLRSPQSSNLVKQWNPRSLSTHRNTTPPLVLFHRVSRNKLVNFQFSTQRGNGNSTEENFGRSVLERMDAGGKFVKVIIISFLPNPFLFIAFFFREFFS